ncbi:MAG: glycosyltransferase family 4 protein [Candidatus Aenigmarchaeota archaeon]|nr:glycosyltransferase family 4 protein [Candidatus Aenigmarchaeota archaeon]
MKIGISATAFFPYEHNLGISNTLYLTTKVLRDKFDLDVSVYVPGTKEMKKEEEFNGIRIRRFPFFRVLTDWTVSAGLLNALKSDGFDLIHSYHYGYFPATAGFLAARSTKVPHVLTTSYHPGQSTLLKSVMMRLYNTVHGKFLLKESSRVLPQNVDELNHLRKIADFNYDIIPCPINDDVFYPSQHKNDRITILFMGTLVPWKGADVAFNICKELEKEHDVRFVFIGVGILEKEMKKHAGRNFTFLKNLPQNVLGRYVRSADIFLYPTKYESFGRVIAEAEMSGLPVISTKVGAVPETAGDGGLLVDYGNWNKMKELVSLLVEDSRLRKRISKKAVKHAGQYKDDAVATRVYDIYREVLK